jgi:hypothetical protein
MARCPRATSEPFPQAETPIFHGPQGTVVSTADVYPFLAGVILAEVVRPGLTAAVLIPLESLRGLTAFETRSRRMTTVSQRPN